MTVQLEHASKSFYADGETILAVDNVDFQASPGEFICILGASGSGKTTLLNLMAGIDVADSGEIVVAGQRLSGRSEADRADIRLRHIGVVFQSNNLLPEFTAAENVALPLMVKGTSRAKARDIAERALDSLRIRDLAARFPERMSGGQRQRVGIARAIAGNQRILLADEPTGALDVEASRQLFSLLRGLCDSSGTVVILATHDPMAREFATRTQRMLRGALTSP